eukprot:gene6900-7116_t
MTNASSRKRGAQVNSTTIEPTANASNSTAAAVQQSTGLPRCKWAGTFSGATSEEYVRYHDEEWGRPVHDDTALFELLVLEGAQAGLSWSTILARRAFYRTGFEGFDPVKVAAFDDAKLTQLMAEGSGVVRHRGKLESAVQNAKAFLQLQQEHGSFCNYVWSFVPDHRPIVNRWTCLSEVPAKTAESEALSKGLKKAGMSFVGPTIMYAFMQAAGLVNDHTIDCHCYSQIIDSYPHRLQEGHGHGLQLQGQQQGQVDNKVPPAQQKPQEPDEINEERQQQQHASSQRSRRRRLQM